MDRIDRFKKVMDILSANDCTNSSLNHSFFDKFSDEQLDDPAMIADAIAKINDANEQLQKETKYPLEIMMSVRQYLGRKRYDSKYDDVINAMSKDEVLNAVATWNNLVDYGSTIKRWVEQIYGITLDGDNSKEVNKSEVGS